MKELEEIKKIVAEVVQKRLEELENIEKKLIDLKRENKIKED